MCGSCWAFSSASLISSYAKINDMSHDLVEVSPQHLVRYILGNNLIQYNNDNHTKNILVVHPTPWNAVELGDAWALLNPLHLPMHLFLELSQKRNTPTQGKSLNFLNLKSLAQSFLIEQWRSMGSRRWWNLQVWCHQDWYYSNDHGIWNSSP